jgi:WS/DGAT/MGAT family acyltransferase
MRDREPPAVELYARALVNSLQRVPRGARISAQTVTRLAGFGKGYLGQLAQMLQESGVPSVKTVRSKLRRPPVTRFSGKVSAHRVVEVVPLPFAGFKVIRGRIEGVSINDLFLATVGGALNKYLGAKGELPNRTMTAQVPMTLRGENKGAHGNQIGFATMPMHSEIEDPLRRLEAIARGAARAKATVSVIGKDLTMHLSDLLPAIAAELFTTKVMLPTMNIVVSNVRGPDIPLYLAGARMVAFAPVSIAMNGLGLNVTGFSYHGTLWVCAVACRDMMPDPGLFATCLRESFDDLVKAAEALPSKTQPADAAKPRSSPAADGRGRTRRATGASEGTRSRAKAQAHGRGKGRGRAKDGAR